MEYGERVGLEHATFTALIFGTNGGMGAECSMFVKELARKLSKLVRGEMRSSMLQCADKKASMRAHILQQNINQLINKQLGSSSS